MARDQIENRNFLAPTGFQFNLKRSPKVAFFCNEANIPDLTLGVALQPNYLRDIPTPGDKIDFGDLSLRFLVDENLENFLEIQNWIRGLGYPEEVQEIRDLAKNGLVKGRYVKDRQNIYSDGTLQILSNNLVPKFNVNFKDLFPTSLTTLTFDATDTDIQYFTANVEFKYTSYNITPVSAAPILPYIPAPTITLTADPNSNVGNGAVTTLTWTTTNASQVSIDNGVGVVDSVNGSVTTNVRFGTDETSKVYTATAIGAGGGPVTATATITRATPATADFFLATYTFSDGRDLDTRTSVVSPSGHSEILGWAKDNFSVGAGITWGGDNTGTGVESILFTKQDFIDNNAGINTISMDFRAGWYTGGEVGFNPVIVNVTSFVGGSMEYQSSSKTWTNPTADETFEGFTSVSKVLSDRIGGADDLGARVAIMDLDFVAGTVEYRQE